MSFSKKVKELREISGLSQIGLSQKIGISAAAIGFLENNDNEPKGSTVAAYARCFNVSADYLLGLEDDFGARVPAATTSSTSPESSTFSREERKIIEQYRKLPEQLRELVRQQLDVYSAPEELLFKPNKKV